MIRFHAVTLARQPAGVLIDKLERSIVLGNEAHAGRLTQTDAALMLAFVERRHFRSGALASQARISSMRRLTVLAIGIIALVVWLGTSFLVTAQEKASTSRHECALIKCGVSGPGASYQCAGDRRPRLPFLAAGREHGHIPHGRHPPVLQVLDAIRSDFHAVQAYMAREFLRENTPATRFNTPT